MALSLDRRSIRILWRWMTLQERSRFGLALSRFHGRCIEHCQMMELVNSMFMPCLIMDNEFGDNFHGLWEDSYPGVLTITKPKSASRISKLSPQTSIADSISKI